MRGRWSLGAAGTGALGLLFGSSSLLGPFGPDQALYFYVAREWLRHGAVPYRDVFDHKTPGIYLVHVVLITVFGEQQWPLRLAEWLATVAIGLAAAGIAMGARKERAPPWLMGFGVLATNVLYFGYFDYWNTGQCEIWCVLGTVFALWTVTRARLPLRPFVLSGSLAGFLSAAVLIMKAPAAPMMVVVLGALLVRARRERALGIAVSSFVVAGALTLAACVAWFAAKGALPDAVDVLVRANGHFAPRERRTEGAAGLLFLALRTHHDVDPLATALRIGLVVGLVRRGRRDVYALALALNVAAMIGVASQLKFYYYHWSLLVAGEVLAAVLVAEDVSEWLAARPALRRWARPITVASLLALFAIDRGSSSLWMATTKNALAYAVGARDRDAFVEPFRHEAHYFFYRDVEAVGLWLRAHARPGDRVLARGYAPGIYVVSGLSYGGRFFWDSPLIDPRRDYRRDEWLEQDRTELARIAPRWVVALRPRTDLELPPRGYSPGEIQSVAWFEQRGYHEVFAQRQFVVMERTN